VLIETERLRLRPLTMDDLDEFVALHAEPDVSRFMLALDREQAIERLQACDREWKTRGHGLLAILDRDADRFLGRTGLRYWPQFDETEVGWALRPHAWGNGYATEAARACITWGLRELGLPYLTAMIRPDNARSINVAERLGMEPLRDDLLRGVPVVVHWIRRVHWPEVPAPGVGENGPTRPKGCDQDGV
jgi:RimJ/RimL family protein N-acetyltransferase